MVRVQNKLLETQIQNNSQVLEKFVNKEIYLEMRNDVCRNYLFVFSDFYTINAIKVPCLGLVSVLCKHKNIPRLH